MKREIKPWGWTKLLAKGKGYKISLLFLKPFAKTDLKRCGDKSRIIILPDSLEYRIIERYQEHCINNMCNKGLYVIEAQIGFYKSLKGVNNG